MADQQLYSADAAVCVSSLERVRARVPACACARVAGSHVRGARAVCARGIQCTEQCTGRCIHTREIIAIGGALVSSRYIDLPASSWLLPKSEDFPPRGPSARSRTWRVNAEAFLKHVASRKAEPSLGGCVLVP